MTAQELSASLREGESYVVDVRGFGEWEEGHLPDVEVGGGTAGIHIPLATLTEHLDEIPRDRRLVVHCLSGERSAIAASVLEANGFPKVTNMAGGLSAWRDAGNPIEMSPDRSFEQPA